LYLVNTAACYGSVHKIEVIGETWWDARFTGLSFYALYVFNFTAAGRNADLSPTRYVISHGVVTSS
jgi:hypothetical protein